MPAQQPTKLGEYKLLEKLGQGGMAIVYRAERTAEAGFKKTVAIKRMIPQYRRSASLLERFAAEARTNARLDHPNLVAVVDFGIEPEPYLVMEFVEGISLALLLQRLVKMGEALDISAACFVAAEAAAGLDHAHRKRDESGNPLGIVHRDVSPQNILLSNEGAVKVSDFGLVKAADNVVQTGSGVPIGKLSYMAPEQADHSEVDARADVFSLGVVLWEMLAMRVLLPPNDPARASHLLKTCAFPPPSTYRPDVPPALEAIVMGCLAKDPTERTPSAQAVGMTLREVLHEIAPGYGRDQLARLLGWAFPEYGWQIDEPHAPAKQPSNQERASIPPAPSVRASMADGPPAAPSHATHVDVQMANPVLVTGPHAPVVAHAAPATSDSGRSLMWIILGVSALGIFGIITLAVGLFLFSVLGSEEDDTAPPVPMAPVTPMDPPLAPMDPGVAPGSGLILESASPGAMLYRGGNLVAALPTFLPLSEVEPGPLVVIAPRHHPTVLDSNELRRRISRDRNRMVIPMVPARHPEHALLVQYPRPAQARIAGGGHRALGPVPGLVLVPATPLGGTPRIEITIDGRIVDTLRTAHCRPSAVCVVQ